MPDGRELPKRVDTYILHEAFAKGGMASAHYGLHLRPAFARPVAIKRLHPNLSSDTTLVHRLLEEARLAVRVRHPNVVPMLDVVTADDEILLVMEYVAGEALSTLLRTAHDGGRPAPPLPVVASIMTGLLEGLQAAHEVEDEHGRPLGLVHRDVSPQNVLVGLDGVSRLLDFGIAKALDSADATRRGQLLGKLAYMAPERLARSERATPAGDVYAAGVVLWEMLTLRRLFDQEDRGILTAHIMAGLVEPPERYAPSVPPELGGIAMRALARDPRSRFPSARAMRDALEAVLPTASNAHVGAWVDELAGETLRARTERLREIERAHASARDAAPPPPVVASPSRSSRRVWLVPAVLLAGALGVALAWPAPAPAHPEATPNAPAPPGTSAAPAPPVPPDSVPADTAAAGTPAPAVAPPPARVSTRRPTVAPSARPKADCDPPWNIGADGIRQYKKGCFQ